MGGYILITPLTTSAPQHYEYNTSELNMIGNKGIKNKTVWSVHGEYGASIHRIYGIFCPVPPSHPLQEFFTSLLFFLRCLSLFMRLITTHAEGDGYSGGAGSVRVQGALGTP